MVRKKATSKEGKKTQGGAVSSRCGTSIRPSNRDMEGEGDADDMLTVEWWRPARRSEGQGSKVEKIVLQFFFQVMKFE